jgi:tetratricopeptide (TPR) repeat protein
MLNYCPECGTKLPARLRQSGGEEDYKFCPNCGIELKSPSINETDSDANSDTNQNPEESAEVEETIIICNNCGEENSSFNEICSSCGVRLKGSTASKKDKPVKTEKTEEKKSYLPVRQAGKQNSASRNKNKKQNKVSQPDGKAGQNKTNVKRPKTLDKTKIYAIVMTVLGVILAFYIIFGEFDSKSVTDVNTTGGQQNKSSGVSLENIQKMNQLRDQLKANPNDSRIQLELANLQFDSGMFEEAIPNYKNYLKSDPENADVIVDLGVCYYNLKNYPTAISEMKTALKYNPKHQTAMMNLGIVNLAAGNMDKAKDWFQKAMNIDPNTEIGKRAKELLDSHQLK